MLRARSAKFSVGQCLAAPNAPPGLRQKTPARGQVGRMLFPEAGQLALIFGEHGRLRRAIADVAVEVAGQSQIFVEHRIRNGPRLGLERVGEQVTSTVAGEADAPLDPGQPGHDGTPQRVGKQHGQVELLALQSSYESPAAGVGGRTVRLMLEDTIEVIESGERVADGWSQHADDFRILKFRPQRPQGRRRHHGVANPIGEEEGDFHAACLPDSLVVGSLEFRSCSRTIVLEIPGTCPSAFTCPPYASTSS